MRRWCWPAPRSSWPACSCYGSCCCRCCEWKHTRLRSGGLTNRWPAPLLCPLPELPPVPDDRRGHDDGADGQIEAAQVDQERHVERQQGGDRVGQGVLAVEDDGEPRRQREDQQVVGQRVRRGEHRERPGERGEAND